MSDTHILCENKSLYASSPAYKLTKAVESINKYQNDADFVVITGDLSNDGALESYKILKDIVDKLTIPYYLILGNHDNRENYLKVFNKQLTAQKFVHFSKIIDNSLLLFLDTLDPNSHSGYLCKSRLEWLENKLEENKNLPAYIFMHHPPIFVHHNFMDGMGLKNKDEFWKIIGKSKNVKHIFFGHVHMVTHGLFNGIGYSSTRSTNHQLALYSTDDQQYNTLENPAYTVVTVNEDQVNCILHEYLNEENIYIDDMG